MGPARSTSTRLTEKRGLEAVAITVIRYRSSAAETCRLFCQGWPLGTNTTSSRSNRCGHLAGGDQVTVMDGVERPTHDSHRAALLHGLPAYLSISRSSDHMHGP